jgi:hypothetical protein
MKPRVYLESSFISHLTARTSKDIIVAGHQRASHEWWDNFRQEFELVVSELVIAEISDGDPVAARERLDVTIGLPLLDSNEDSEKLSELLFRSGNFPPKAMDDAGHVGISAVHCIPFLLTWNCRHLANAVIRPRVEAICLAAGFKAPAICTPDELMEKIR